MKKLAASYPLFLDTKAGSVLHPRSSDFLDVFREIANPAQLLWKGPSRLIVTGRQTAFTFPSRIEAVNEAAASVARTLNDLGTPDDVNFAIDMSIREAVTNAVLHGNKLDEAKKVDVLITASESAVEIQVTDQGSGFKPEEVPDPTAAENIMKTSGRGIFFMRTFMDEVEWSSGPTGGTAVRMVKRF